MQRKSRMVILFFQKIEDNTQIEAPQLKKVESSQSEESDIPAKVDQSEDQKPKGKELENQKVRAKLTVGEQAHNMCDLALVDTNVYRKGLRKGLKLST